MKRLYFIFTFALIATNAVGDCIMVENYYISCNAGYYLNSTSHKCIKCPNIDNTVDYGGTSNDNNTEGVTACYLSARTLYDDESGYFQVADECHYVGAPRPPRPQQTVE